MLEAVTAAFILVALGGTYCLLQLRKLITERHHSTFAWHPLKAEDLGTNIRVVRVIWGPSLERLGDPEVLQLRAILRGAFIASAVLILAILALVLK